MILKIYLVVLLGGSINSFYLYAIDKRRAKRGAWRLPERMLLSAGFIGGALGALVAMQLLRHKTRHYYFYLVNILGLAWQVALIFHIALNGL